MRSRPFFIFGLDNHGTSLKLANDLEIDFIIWGKYQKLKIKVSKPNLGLE